MKNIIIVIGSMLCYGCGSILSYQNKAVTKMAVIMPVEENGQSVDAIADFLGGQNEIWTEFEKNRMNTPPANWTTVYRNDGVIQILWTSTRSSHERPYLIESGFFPLEIPDSAITILDQKRGVMPEPKPIKIAMVGSTAYLPKRDRQSFRKVK